MNFTLLKYISWLILKSQEKKNSPNKTFWYNYDLNISLKTLFLSDDKVATLRG